MGAVRSRSMDAVRSRSMDAVRSRGMVADYLRELGGALDELASQQETLGDITTMLLRTLQDDRRVYLFGNGGSAATASHAACDLIKTAAVEGKPRLQAQCLNDSMPVMTALANDISYNDTLSWQVDALLRKGDVLIIFSASGNSPNLLAGIAAAKAKGVSVVGILGFGGGAAKAMCDAAMVCSSREYGPAEDFHIIVTHVLTVAVRNAQR